MKITPFTLTIGDHVAGGPISIQGYRLDSQQPGKSIYIQGGLHGGEVTYWIIQQLHNYLKKHLKSGQIILVPIANPVSWMTRSYFHTPGKFDLYMGKDWNRNFPGNDTGSLGQRIAHTLFQEAIQHDFVIDLHTSRKSLPFGIISKPNMQYAKIIGLELNNLDEDLQGVYTNAFSNQIDTKNIPNVTLECGSHDSYEEDVTQLCFVGLKRLLRHLNMIDETIQGPSITPKYYTDLTTYYAPTGGFIKFLKTIGTEVKKGESLYEISTVNNLEKVEIITANENCVIQKISPTHIYWPGDEVMQVIPTNNIQILV